VFTTEAGEGVLRNALREADESMIDSCDWGCEFMLRSSCDCVTLTFLRRCGLKWEVYCGAKIRATRGLRRVRGRCGISSCCCAAPAFFRMELEEVVCVTRKKQRGHPRRATLVVAEWGMSWHAHGVCCWGIGLSFCHRFCWHACVAWAWHPASEFSGVPWSCGELLRGGRVKQKVVCHGFRVSFGEVLTEHADVSRDRD